VGCDNYDNSWIRRYVSRRISGENHRNVYTFDGNTLEKLIHACSQRFSQDFETLRVFAKFKCSNHTKYTQYSHRIIVIVTLACCNVHKEINKICVSQLQGNKQLVPNFAHPLSIIESVCMAWFVLEFLVRFLFCPSKLGFVKSLINWIDFCKLCSFYRMFSIEHRKRK
jgi:hypothetical protein